MKKKILAIFATALLLALCAVPCFAYPSQNLSFGGFYQNEDVTPYSVQEFDTTMEANQYYWIFHEENLSQEINGFILEVNVPFMSGYGGTIRLICEQWFSEDYSTSDTIQVSAYSDQASMFYFVVPRRGVDSLHISIYSTEYYTFVEGEDAPITTTLYPISLNTDEIEETAYNSGYQGGYNDGRAQGQGDAEDLDGFLVDIFGALAEFFTPLAEFEIWGISVMGILSLVVVGTIAVIIFKMKG